MGPTALCMFYSANQIWEFWLYQFPIMYSHCLKNTSSEHIFIVIFSCFFFRKINLPLCFHFPSIHKGIVTVNTWLFLTLEETLKIITNSQVNDDTDNKHNGPFKHSHASLAGRPITHTLGRVTSLLYQYHCKKHPKICNST